MNKGTNMMRKLCFEEGERCGSEHPQIKEALIQMFALIMLNDFLRWNLEA